MTLLRFNVELFDFSQRLKAWWPPMAEPEAETTAVVSAPPLELPERKTAVAEFITIDTLDAVYEPLFNIFYDADARRMVIADDPVLAGLELPRRWPNMECCIAGQNANEMFWDRADICLSHGHLLEIDSSSNPVQILLMPGTDAEKVPVIGQCFAQRFVVILYGEG